MADNAKGKQDEERHVTRRVVVKRELVLVVPEGTQEELKERVDAAVKALGGPKQAPAPAWLVMGEAEGSKTQAIEHFAGKPNTPDAKAGAYRAPSVTAWKGGAQYEAPPEPLFARKPLED